MERSGNLSAEQYEEMAQFISYYVNYLPLKYKDTAIRYINTAMKIQPRESMFRTKRNIYWVTNDVKGVEAVTGEWISYLRSLEDDNSATIKRLDEELVRFKVR